MNRSLVTAVAAVMLTGALAGCGSLSGASNSATAIMERIIVWDPNSRTHQGEDAAPKAPKTAKAAKGAAPAAPAAPETPAPAAPATLEPAAPAAPATLEPAAPATASTPAPSAAAGPVTLVAKGDVIDTLKASGQFTVLLQALNATNLTPVLKGPGPITVLAPTDAAFQALPPALVAGMMQPANLPVLQKLLVYHLINADAGPAKIQGTQGPVKTASGADVQIDATGSVTMFNNASALAHVAATNGTIYALDKVLNPAVGATPKPVAAAEPAPAPPPPPPPAPATAKKKPS